MGESCHSNCSVLNPCPQSLIATRTRVRRVSLRGSRPSCARRAAFFIPSDTNQLTLSRPAPLQQGWPLVCYAFVGRSRTARAPGPRLSGDDRGCHGATGHGASGTMFWHHPDRPPPRVRRRERLTGPSPKGPIGRGYRTARPEPTERPGRLRVKSRPDGSIPCRAGPGLLSAGAGPRTFCHASVATCSRVGAEYTPRRRPRLLLATPRPGQRPGQGDPCGTGGAEGRAAVRPRPAAAGRQRPPPQGPGGAQISSAASSGTKQPDCSTTCSTGPRTFSCR